MKLKWIRRVWNWIRFGKVKEMVRAKVDGHAAEIEYYDRKGRLVGFWAYGFWRPDFPYHGDDA